MDTIRPQDGDFGTVTTAAFRTMANTVRDIDTDARIIVELVDVDANGLESDTHHAMFTFEYETPDPGAAPRSGARGFSFHSVKGEAPKKYRDIFGRHDEAQWLASFSKEMQNLSSCWYWCSKPLDSRPVRCHLVWTLKRHADGSIDRYKCRCVLDCSVMSKEDVGETFQHVGETDTSHFMCAEAAQFKKCLIQTDAQGAFLEGVAPKEMHAYPPDGVQCPRDENGRQKIWCVDGNVYGKLDAPRVYGQCFDNHMLKFPSVGDMGNITVLIKRTADVSAWHFTRTYVDGYACKLNMLTCVDDNAPSFDNDKYGWCLHRDV